MNDSPFIPIEELVDTLQDSLKETFTNDFLEPIGYLPLKMGHSKILLARKKRTRDLDFYVYHSCPGAKSFNDLVEKELVFVSAQTIKEF